MKEDIFSRVLGNMCLPEKVHLVSHLAETLMCFPERVKPEYREALSLYAEGHPQKRLFDIHMAGKVGMTSVKFNPAKEEKELDRVCTAFHQMILEES